MISFPKTPGIPVERGFWTELLQWKPWYWTKLPLDLRELINKRTIAEAERLLRCDGYDLEHYEYFRKWKGHDYALLKISKKVMKRRREMCRDGLSQRADQIMKYRRTYCGARKKTGEQCQGLAEPGRNRCRFHGGLSDGPKTIDGKIRSLAKLRQYRNRPDLLAKKIAELESNFAS